MGALDRARQKARGVHEKLYYTGRCAVYELQPVRDPDTNLTEMQPVVVLTDQPCRISFKTITATSPADGAATVTQTVKLLLAPEVTIKPGSQIRVTQNGVTADYESSGQPAVYSGHQEIVLERFRGWA